MYYVELWRCSSCDRILGRELRIGSGSFVSAVCWGEGCGEMNALMVGPHPAYQTVEPVAAGESKPASTKRKEAS